MRKGRKEKMESNRGERELKQKKLTYYRMVKALARYVRSATCGQSECRLECKPAFKY